MFGLDESGGTLRSGAGLLMQRNGGCRGAKNTLRLVTSMINMLLWMQDGSRGRCR